MARQPQFPFDLDLLTAIVESMPDNFSTLDVANDERMVQRYWPPSCLWRYGFYSLVGRWLSAYKGHLNIDILKPRISDGGGALWRRHVSHLRTLTT